MKTGPYLFLLTALICNAAANILIKYTMSRSGDAGAEVAGAKAAGAAGLMAKFGAFLNPTYIAALVLFGLNLLAYSVALKTLRISVAYPIMVSGGYLLILLAGWFLFHERLSLVQYGGITLIVAGIWLVVR